MDSRRRTAKLKIVFGHKSAADCAIYVKFCVEKQFLSISEIEQIPERISCFPNAACSSAGGGFSYRLRYTFYFVDIFLPVISLAIECRKEELLNTSSKPGLNKENNYIPTIVDENSEHCDKDKPSDGADHNHRYNTLIRQETHH